MFDYLIVGAGLSGACFAYEMSKKNKSCIVIDKRNHVAGNCYTEKTYDITVHKYGAHIFRTSDLNLWQYINSIEKFIPFRNEPKAIYHDRIYSLPFNMNLFNELFHAVTPNEAKKIIDNDKVSFKFEPKTVEQKALSTIGSTLYKMFVKEYTEKQWDRQCSELPSSTIGDLKLRFTYDNNYFDDVYSGIPLNGYTSFINSMLSKAKVILNCDYFNDRNALSKLAKKIVFTGRIDEFYNYAFGSLEYRSLEFVHEKLNCDNFQGNAVINYCDNSVSFTRLIEHRHFDKFCKAQNTIVSKEYPVKFKDKLNIPFYPMLDENNLNKYKNYADLSKKSKNVIFLGRLANYQYDSMDIAIKKALELANKEV